MHDLEHLQDFVSAGLVIIVISIVLTFAWLSTYVRDHPFVATTVVVLQQETATMYEPRESGDSPSGQPEINQQAEKNAAANTCEKQSVLNSDNPSAALTDPESFEDESNFDSVNISSDELISKSEELISSAERLIRSSPSSSDEIEVSMASSHAIEDDNTQERSILNIADSGDENPVLLKRRKLKKESDEVNSLRNQCASEVFNAVEVPVESEVNSDTISSDRFTGNSESIPPGFIRIRLKFLDDTQRLVRGQLSELVGNFKRSNFEIELSTNCAVRLIFNGKLLNKDSSTLDQYGLFDNCVVHCYVGQPQPHTADETSSNSTHSESEDIDLSEILSPLLLIVVVLLWYLRYEYSHIFNTSATVILVCLTALLLISQYALTITFNISMAFNNSVIGNHQSGNSDDSPPSSSSSQGSTDGERELDESPNTVAAEIEQSNLESPQQPCGGSDLNNTSSATKVSANMHDCKLQKRKTSENSQRNPNLNSTMVSVS